MVLILGGAFIASQFGRDPSWEAVIADFTVVLAVSTTLLWWETRRLAQVSVSQANDLKRSVDAAEKAADAAFKQARVAELALIGVERPLLQLTPQLWGPPLPGPRKNTTPLYNPTIKFTLKNHGRIAARLRACIMEIRAVEREGDSDLMVPVPGEAEFGPIMAADVLKESMWLPPDAAMVLEYSTYVDIEGDKLTAMWGLGVRRLILFGLLDYEDAIGLRRHMGFTYMFYPMTGDGTHSGEGRWDLLDDDVHQFDRIVGGLV